MLVFSGALRPSSHAQLSTWQYAPVHTGRSMAAYRSHYSFSMRCYLQRCCPSNRWRNPDAETHLERLDHRDYYALGNLLTRR